MHLYAYSLYIKYLFPVCMHILYYCLHILLILTKLPVLFFTLHNIVFLVRFQLSDATNNSIINTTTETVCTYVYNCN